MLQSHYRFENYELYVIQSPKSNILLFSSLESLGKSIISESFNKSEDVILVKPLLTIYRDDEKFEAFTVKNKVSSINCFKEGKCGIGFICDLGFDISNLNVSLFSNIQSILTYIHKIDNEFGEILIEFKPNMLMNLKKCLGDILRLLIDSCLKVDDIEIDIKLFNKTDEIGIWIYNQVFLGKDELMPKLDELRKLKEEIEKLREILITTSYS